MYPQGRHPAPHQPGQPGFKFTVAESCDRIKDEFQFLQAQYHSLKVEYDKLANEKTEMQRHYVMYYEMSYGLNIEMHKQNMKTCIADLRIHPYPAKPGAGEHIGASCGEHADRPNNSEGTLPDGDGLIRLK
ncbi:unnamed protein product [Menidia menidia]|uniref:(Atlantic silverside) hypothetical protein n=1 Tax=Menidia menidia TaxID=238744 RepID=A0A8S4A8W3_9TELE|nr:unnamed protein product [Menidia menidia]